MVNVSTSRLRAGCWLLAALSVVLTAAAPSAADETAVAALAFDDTLVTRVPHPTDIDWTPDGRLLVTSLGGELWVQRGDQPRRLALDLGAVTCTTGDSGLLSLTVHPRFTATRWVYVYYTFERFGPCDPPRQAVARIKDGPEPASPVVERVSRFVLSDRDVIDPASEEVILETPPATALIHHGGDIHFARDGLLYIFVGDAQTNRDPKGSPAGDPARLFGKVLRVAESGVAASGNPFGKGRPGCAGRGGLPAPPPTQRACPEVLAVGLRNPFRAAFDPDAPTARFFVNDVGLSTFEEINEGRPGADYGWPRREGPCPFEADPASCSPPPAGLTDPIFFYGRDLGASITGGAFVPDGLWPGADDAYLYADITGTISRLDAAPGGGFTPSVIAKTTAPVVLRFGPHGASRALYYANFVNGEIRRLVPVVSDAEGDETGETFPVAGGDAGE